MSLSVEGASTIREKWYSSSKFFFLNVLNSDFPDFSMSQVSMLLWEVMRNDKLDEFIHELVHEEQAFIADEWHLETPMGLTSDGIFSGNVRIDMAGNESDVSVDFLCAAVKLACYFYQAHINIDFDCLNYCRKLDEFNLRYRIK